MRTSKPISVTLGPLQASVNRRLATGQYDSASEVLRAGLRALEREEAALDDLLRQKVLASIANKKPNIPAEAVFKRLEARHARKVKAAKRDA